MHYTADAGFIFPIKPPNFHQRHASSNTSQIFTSSHHLSTVSCLDTICFPGGRLSTHSRSHNNLSTTDHSRGLRTAQNPLICGMCTGNLNFGFWNFLWFIKFIIFWLHLVKLHIMNPWTGLAYLQPFFSKVEVHSCFSKRVHWYLLKTCKKYKLCMSALELLHQGWNGLTLFQAFQMIPILAKVWGPLGKQMFLINCTGCGEWGGG
jgi:hypothetical protein